MSQSIRQFMGIGAQGIGASQPAQRPGLRETFKEFFKKDNLKKAMKSPIAMTGKEYFANPKTATQGLQMAQKLQAGKYPTSAAAQQLLAGKPVTGLGGLQAQMMYHGTKPTNIPNIMSEGFKAKPAAGGFSIQAADLKMSGPKTFATPVKPMAAMYGKPINVVMPAMANKLSSGAVALGKLPGAIGAAATVGPAAFDLTTALLENTPLGGMVESAGASLANTQVGQQLAEALGVPQTPNLQQGIQTIEPEPVPREFRKLTFEVDPRNPFGADTAESALSYLNRTRLGSSAFQPEYYYYGEGDDFYQLGSSSGKVYDYLMNPDLTSLGAYTSTPISFGQLPTNLQQYGIGEFLP
jgi:hypothetical protein